VSAVGKGADVAGGSGSYQFGPKAGKYSRSTDFRRYPMIERSAEAQAFLVTIDDTPPEAVSACDGWTAHEVAAHVTGIAVEVIRHLEPYLQGDEVPATRSFEEREAPLQALGHSELVAELEAKEHMMRAIVGEVLEQEPGAVIPWTGRQMAVAKFIPHLRNEHALHRWDIAGDDDVSAALLAQSDLIGHSVGVLGEILLRAGRRHDPDPGSPFQVCLRSDGEPDLRVVVEDGTARLTWAEGQCDDPWVELGPAARLSFVWGRRPDSRGQIRSHLSQPQLGRLQALLSGY
jgi:Mycothiol maleylpyruvate isomerase N-terminal domain